MITLTVKQFAAIKRIAMNVAPYVQKKQRLLAKLKDLQKDIQTIQDSIDAQQDPVFGLTKYFSTEDLVTRVGGKYTFNPDIVHFDEEKRVYTIVDPDENPEVPGQPVSEENSEEDGSQEELLPEEISVPNPEGIAFAKQVVEDLVAATEPKKEAPEAAQGSDFDIDAPKDSDEAPEVEDSEEIVDVPIPDPIEEDCSVTVTDAPEFTEPKEEVFDPFDL